MPEALQRLLTIDEVADCLRLSQKTLRRLIARGRIPCVRIGSRLRFDQQDILRWISARKED